jgi:hypothetical protein
MSVLAGKLRAAREQRVEAEGFTFIVRRPTEVDMVSAGRREMNAKRALAFLCGTKATRADGDEPLLVGWDGVTSLAMFPGGDAQPLTFDIEAAEEWFRDRIDLLMVVAKAAIDAYTAHQAQRDAERKN